ncbi:MAG TPA: ATP-binding protein [Candidatus Synoicihabitans sp.]|nr:ATP-binding protein [Candidatus Synoicihabitans sp.]
MSSSASLPRSDSPWSIDQALATAFLENVPDNVYFKDRESRFIAVSRSQLKTFSVTSVDQLLGKTDFDFFDEAHARPAYEDEQRIIRTGEPLVGRLEKETWPDGRVTWVITHKLPLRNEKGEIIGTFGISKDVTEARRTEEALEQARKELMDASRIAGMAEVATGVLHNVGNVLNSLNVSASVLAVGLRETKVESLEKIAEMLRAQGPQVGQFLSEDPRGRRVPELISALAAHFAEERKRMLAELKSLQEGIDHVKDIVAMQQAYATMVSVAEALEGSALMEDAVRMNAAALMRHDVRVIRDFQPAPRVLVEKGRVLQILVNLIRNAKYACDEGAPAEKQIVLRVEPRGETVDLIVEDNGVGIPAENVTKIFRHGFTTRSDGHGFGLHSSANAAREMGGSLTVHSDGPGRGARFTLTVPVAQATPVSHAA